MKYVFVVFILFFSIVLNAQSTSQAASKEDIRKMISQFKKDERGPYQAIRWFCQDGSILPPKERCPQPGGIQHAIAKEVVVQLAQNNKIYFGQILAGTDFEEFWDSSNGNSRIKQYILEQYLQSIDDGWIMKRGKYYRGAIQAEDEADWGYRFLSWLVSNDDNISSNYFLVRQSFRSIPHNNSDKLWERIRAVSKVLSDSLESFTNIRVKLHGQPDRSDIKKVEDYINQNKTKIKENLLPHFDQLATDLNEAYKPVDSKKLRAYLKFIPADHSVNTNLNTLITLIDNNNEIDKDALKRIIQLMWQCRKDILSFKPVSRFALFDLSITLETLLFQYIDNWQTYTATEMLEKASEMTTAIVACGFLEMWEYNKIHSLVKFKNQKTMSLDVLQLKTDYIKRSVDWGSSMVRSVYQDELSKFSEFEPLAINFIDDRIRVSPLLPLGNLAGKLIGFYTKNAGITNFVLNIPSQNQVRGLNSGYALGEIVLLESITTDYNFNPDKIYVLAHPPADLKPVAGILTVSEGNLVSHVQLLARNLGIPNSVISSACLQELKSFAGKKVFYAVSPKGSVVMKLEREMEESEKNLFKTSAIREDKFSVPVDKIDIKETGIIDLDDLRAENSGILTGPKAANLGELKYLFPENVVQGFVLPFGIYRRHLNQLMPGKTETYWEFLNRIFTDAAQKRNIETEKEIEEYVLKELLLLRNAIKKINLLQEFRQDVKKAFIDIFGKPIGEIPVFLRSDTNMEDLKDFTGAGLNLTVFNVKDENAIWQGVRDVWASPFSERSYRWRQRLLLNPENVYPSILLIPSVDNDKSGVMITTGVFSGDKTDITVAFNRGSGGAVEGQMAESYSIKNTKENILLNPGREKQYTSLPYSGGIAKVFTYFDKSILSDNNLKDLLDFSIVVKNKMKGKKGFEKSVPLDIELGFKGDKIWLFQVRPFVESKKAKLSQYLNNMDPEINMQQLINLEQDI